VLIEKSPFVTRFVPDEPDSGIVCDPSPDGLESAPVDVSEVDPASTDTCGPSPTVASDAVEASGDVVTVIATQTFDRQTRPVWQSPLLPGELG
jgi:hypothetical protein